MAKKSAREIKQEKLELELAEKLQPFKMRFNDICMREYGLDITEEDDYVYDMDTESILQFKEKFIKYCEECNPYLKPNEIEFKNVIKLKVPKEYTYFYEGDVMPAGTKFIVAFIGGNINDIKIIGRYDD